MKALKWVYGKKTPVHIPEYVENLGVEHQKFYIQKYQHDLLLKITSKKDAGT